MLARCMLLVAFAAALAIGAVSAFAQSCPPPVRAPQAGDRCTGQFDTPSRDRSERWPVFVVRMKQLDSSDLSSWSVPGAVVVPLDGLQRGQQLVIPLSLLSECRP